MSGGPERQCEPDSDLADAAVRLLYLRQARGEYVSEGTGLQVQLLVDHHV
jgi:hypothetical protein